MALTCTDRGTGGQNSTTFSTGMSPTSNCTAGARVVLVVAYDNAGTNGVDPYTGIADGHGNTWTSRVAGLRDPGSANQGCVLRIFETPQDVATLTTASVVTVSFGTGTQIKNWAFVEVVSSIAAAINYHDAAAGTGATTASPTVTTSSLDAGDALIAGGASELADSWTGDSDTTNGTWSTKQSAGGGAMSVIAQHKIVTGSGTQTYNPTVTSSDVVLGWVAFREAAPPPAAGRSQAIVIG